MADIPYGTYTVTLGNSQNNWANGALVYNSQGVTYKGQSVSGWNPDVNDVSWNVTLNHSGQNCPVSFTNGHYSDASGQGQITLGEATSSCFVDIEKDPEDTWTAEAGPGEEVKSAQTYRA